MTDRAPAIHLDRFDALGGGFLARGWAWHPDDPRVEFALARPGGGRTAFRPFRYPRPDASAYCRTTGLPAGPPNLGFVGFCPADEDAPGGGWEVVVRAPGRPPAVRPAEPSAATPEALRAALLELLDLEGGCGPLLTDHVAPALERVQARITAGAEVASVDDCGPRLAGRPLASMVVPLYGRYDFLEHQLIQFAADPDFSRVDLIYVLDSPELAAEVRVTARRLADFYRVGLRLVALAGNCGYSGANNAGAAFARADRLVFLNSDVFPVRPGWVSALTGFAAAHPQAGAVGAKLLYENGGLQHAGMFFRRPAGLPYWVNMHYYKGLPGGLPAANTPRPVPAVTGACLLIDRRLYDAVGGFDGRYVFGDYEDSDLCLRVWQAGREVWYCPAAELYHLEGQSYPSAVRSRASLVNAWLHAVRWGPAIEALTARFATPGAAA